MGQDVIRCRTVNDCALMIMDDARYWPFFDISDSRFVIVLSGLNA